MLYGHLMVSAFLWILLFVYISKFVFYIIQPNPLRFFIHITLISITIFIKGLIYFIIVCLCNTNGYTNKTYSDEQDKAFHNVYIMTDIFEYITNIWTLHEFPQKMPLNMPVPNGIGQLLEKQVWKLMSLLSPPHNTLIHKTQRWQQGEKTDVISCHRKHMGDKRWQKKNGLLSPERAKSEEVTKGWQEWHLFPILF